MPKLKSHRGAAKRFKKTATGKFVRSKAFKQHILTSKTRSRKRHLKGTVVVSPADQAKLRRMLPERSVGMRDPVCGIRGARRRWRVRTTGFRIAN
jgi:large subunit ribosomal protein L35